MGKRSNFERRERDFYPTPPAAVAPLLPFLKPTYHGIYEPCAGDGALVDCLTENGQDVVGSSDIEPRRKGIKKLCAGRLRREHVSRSNIIVTNPPWDFETVYMIWCGANRVNLPCWFLLPADFAHNRQSGEMMRHCAQIVSVGRVKWISGSAHTGKDNCAWYLFQPFPVAVTAFVGRAA